MHSCRLQESSTSNNKMLIFSFDNFAEQLMNVFISHQKADAEKGYFTPPFGWAMGDGNFIGIVQVTRFNLLPAHEILSALSPHSA